MGRKESGAVAAERLFPAIRALLAVAAKDVVLPSGTAAVVAELTVIGAQVSKMLLPAAPDALVGANVRLELRVQQFDPPALAELAILCTAEVLQYEPSSHALADPVPLGIHLGEPSYIALVVSRSCLLSLHLLVG